MSAIVLFVEPKLVPGARKNFLARARQYRQKVLENEPDCHRFDLLAPHAGPCSGNMPTDSARAATWTAGGRG